MSRQAVLLQAQLDKSQKKLDQLLAQQQQVQVWGNRLREDNQLTPNPVRMRLLLDGGFASGENLTYLLELGYDAITLGNGQCVKALRQEQPPEPDWLAVTESVKLWEGEVAPVGTCPYPLRRILMKWEGRPLHSRYSMLLVYDQNQPLSLPETFSTYHHRQHSEAGNKQGKSTFNARGIRVRSAAGLELLNLFAFVFWPNFIHWATDWLQPRVRESTNAFRACLGTLKTQVRVGAQAAGFIRQDCQGKYLQFSTTGPYPGVVIQLSGTTAYQPYLSLFLCKSAFQPMIELPLLSKPAAGKGLESFEKLCF